MAFSPDGKSFAVGAVENTVQVRDTTTLLETHLFLGHILTITKVVFSADGRSLFSASRDGTVRIWGLAE
jgi:WD40 repeat protein